MSGRHITSGHAQMSSSSAPEANNNNPPPPPAEAWQLHWFSSLPRLDHISRLVSTQKPGGSQSLTVMRSSQLDAQQLDEELKSMLREQFMKIFSFFNPGAITRLQPELFLVLNFLIFRYSVWEHRPLPGMSLMNLRFRNERHTSSRHPSFGGRTGVEGPGLSRAQRILYCLGAIGLPYVWIKVNRLSAAGHWGDQISLTHPNDALNSDFSNRWIDSIRMNWRGMCWKAMRRAEALHRLASLANLLAFLRTGRYRSLLERLLGARLVYVQPSAARAISYEYLNRQLVWSELSELLLTLLPLLNSDAVKRALKGLLPRIPPPAFFNKSSSGAAAGRLSEGESGNNIVQTCRICNASEAIMPYSAQPCGHIYCYYCLRASTLADVEYSCPTCGLKIDALKPAAGGGFVDKTASS